MSRRPTEFHYYDWQFNRWFGSETRARCRALPSDYPMGLIANAAEGAYRNLLDYCYHEGDIPEDIGGLSSLCGMAPDVFEMVWPAFRHKFHAHKSKAGRLTHEEVSLRRRAWKQKRKQNTDAGNKSAESRRIDKPNEGIELGSDRSAEVNDRCDPLNQERRKKKEVISNNSIARELSVRLIGRHPELRSNKPGEVRKKLQTLLNRVGKQKHDRLASMIDGDHICECSSEKWQKQNGEFAKGLCNWVTTNADDWVERLDSDSDAPSLFKMAPPSAPKLLITELYGD